MRKATIGENAGKIYRHLEGNGSATAAKIKKDLSMDTADMNMALGWLAREHKITFNKKGSSVSISLS